MGKKTDQKEPEIETDAPSGESVEDTEQNPAEPEITLEEELRNQLIQAREESKVHKEQYLRTLADMENLRKRTQREKEDLAKYANESILREILPVIDNLERAVEHAEQTDSNAGLLEGVQMTLTQFSQVLAQFGVEPVDATGQPFDPAYHQAMGQLESAEQPPNTVVQQMQKGYQLHNRLLRPAFVMVAKPPAEADNQETEAEDNPDSPESPESDTE